MKAVIWTKYGPAEGLQLREAPKPTPKENEVLVKVHACTVSAADTEFRRLKLPLLYSLFLRLYLGIFRPSRVKIPGTEFAGEIEATGQAVTRYTPGDPVFGYTGLNMGTYAEYLCLPEAAAGLGGVMALKPVNLTYEQAAAVPFGGLEALHALGQAHLQSGQKVLIVGAGGSIGTYAVQLAVRCGAEVTGVDKAEKLEMLRSLGAAQVIDYTREDFSKNGQTYDVILDTVDKSRFSSTLRSLKENGTYLNARPGLLGRMRVQWTPQTGGQKIIPWTAGYTTENLLVLKELIEAGTIRPVIDRRYTLEQITEAHRYVDKGEKKGNVVVALE